MFKSHFVLEHCGFLQSRYLAPLSNEGTLRVDHTVGLDVQISERRSGKTVYTQLQGRLPISKGSLNLKPVLAPSTVSGAPE